MRLPISLSLLADIADDMRILRWAVQTRARYVGHDRLQAQSDRNLQDAAERRRARALVRPRPTRPSDSTSAPSRPRRFAVAITAELIAIRRHANAALPHMSWFRSQKSQAVGEDAADAALDESK